MALDINTVWETRGVTGDDTNGGGYVPGSSGVDYSQQNSPQYSVSSAGIMGIDNTRMASGVGVSANDVGNIVNVISGSGFTPGRYHITALAGAYWQLDRACGTAGSSGGVIKMGGALKTIQKALDLFTSLYMQVYVQADGVYTISANLVPATVGDNYTDMARITGYTTTRGDGGFVTVRATAGVTSMVANVSLFGCLIWEHFDFDGNNVSGTAGVVHQNSYGGGFLHCRIRRMVGRAAYITSTGMIAYCDIHDNGCGAVGVVEVSDSRCRIIGNWVHGNTGGGSATGAIGGGGANLVSHNVVSANASCNGVASDFGTTVMFNSIFNNGGAGIFCVNYPALYHVMGNILVNNSGYGIGSNVAPTRRNFGVNFNAFYGNGSGAGPGTFGGNPNDVVLTGNPFMDPTPGVDDFRLNNLTGRGAACRAAGFPQAFLDAGPTVSYLDLGAVQHTDAAARARSVQVSWQ